MGPSRPPAQPRLVTDLLRWSGPQIAGTFRGEDLRARTASVSWAGHGPVPAWLDQARELSDHGVHEELPSWFVAGGLSAGGPACGGPASGGLVSGGLVSGGCWPPGGY
jgi:hypothetical protein